MSRYTTRVELHDGTGEDYETLHTAMADEGFSRTIVAGDGIEYYMPMAEYNYEGEVSRDVVFEAAKRAAKQTDISYAVLVTESAGRTWVGLQSVKKKIA